MCDFSGASCTCSEGDGAMEQDYTGLMVADGFM